MHISRLAVLMALGLSSVAMAGPILVQNASFETISGALPISCGASCAYTVGPISGWTTTGTVGQFSPGPSGGNFSNFDVLTDGITIAYADNGTISQTVLATVQLGATYTLRVDVGVRKNAPNPGLVQLVIGGTTYVAATGVLPSPGNWNTFTAVYTGLLADVGKTIGIQLSTSSVQGAWDNVRLDETASTAPTVTPEPGALSLLSFGLGGLGLVARRRNA